jgi:hypothetical protein
MFVLLLLLCLSTHLHTYRIIASNSVDFFFGCIFNLVLDLVLKAVKENMDVMEINNNSQAKKEGNPVGFHFCFQVCVVFKLRFSVPSRGYF